MMTGPRHHHLPVVRQLDLHAGKGGAHGADARRPGRVQRGHRGGLRHPPQLEDLDPQREEELEHLGGRGRGARDEELRLVEPEPLADPGEDQLVGLRRLLRQLGGQLLAGLLRSDPAQADLDRPFRGLLSLLVLLGLDPRLERGLQLLPDARHAAEEGGAYLGHVGKELLGVRAGGERVAVDERRVMAQPAVGDVGRREVGDVPAARSDWDDLVECVQLGHQVVVGELHALRRPGGAGRVDQAQHVLGLDRAPGGLEVEALVAARLDFRQRNRALRRPIDRHHVLQRRHVLLGGEHALEEGPLGDEHPVARVAQQVLDLIRRGGVVDREAGGSEVHRRQVHEVELRPVGQHQAEGVPALYPQARQPGGDVPDALGVLAPGDRHGVALRAESDLVGALGGRDLKGLAEGGGLEGLGPGAGL
jgi:hypothetical protein